MDIYKTFKDKLKYKLTHYGDTNYDSTKSHRNRL